MLLNVLFRVDLAGWLAVAICIGMVLAFEALNTAIEALVDLVSPEYHDLAKRAKDCAAGAVLLASLAALAVVCLVWLRF